MVSIWVFEIPEMCCFGIFKYLWCAVGAVLKYLICDVKYLKCAVGMEKGQLLSIICDP
jgi:hypothetical protein